MVEPAETRRLQSMLRAAVQSVRWTYSLFWKLCPQQGILVWGEGYYNGAIKTRKTTQPTEVTTEEATQHRSQQLRELYDSLSAESSNLMQAQRPAAALSPEDLTETEWFYLLCVSFSFPPGFGLPGNAYEKREHVWLTRANEADNKIFSRSIIAKSARIQTVVCVPLLDGVVELGTTERVQEDIGLIQRVKTFFHYDGQSPNLNYPPRPALSEQSTSNNPTTYPVLRSPPVSTYPPFNNELGYEEEEEVNPNHQNPRRHNVDRGPMQLNGSTRFESPDGGSNNLNPNFDLLSVGQSQGYNEMEQEDTHYSKTVSTVLRTQSAPRPSNSGPTSATASAFSTWQSSGPHLKNPARSQRALKHILFQAGREKLNERFSALRALVPLVAKNTDDRASILDDTIEYVKKMRTRVRELESRAGVEVSIIDGNALVEIECSVEKDGNLLQGLMQVLGGIGMEVTTVQSSICDGVFAAELRAKVKENVGNSRKINIKEVKRCIHQIIPHF